MITFLICVIIVEGYTLTYLYLSERAEASHYRPKYYQARLIALRYRKRLTDAGLYERSEYKDDPL